DPRLAAGDPLALVAPLGVGETGVKDRDASRVAGADPADRLRREGDLRNEDDRTETALERRLAGLEVHLGLARPGGAVEQNRAPRPRVEAGDDLPDRGLLLRRQLLGRALAGKRLPLVGRRLLLPALRRLGRDERERSCRRRAVVVGEPERELDERRR